MTCYIHQEKNAVGTCVGCGKFICEDCNTEINAKNYCKKCVNEIFNERESKLKEAQNKSEKQQPMVFMNAGGGGASSSSSSSSSGLGGFGGIAPYPRNSILLHIALFFFTAGVGNIIYFLYVSSKQKEWKRMYQR